MFSFANLNDKANRAMQAVSNIPAAARKVADFILSVEPVNSTGNPLYQFTAKYAHQFLDSFDPEKIYGMFEGVSYTLTTLWVNVVGAQLFRGLGPEERFLIPPEVIFSVIAAYELTHHFYLKSYWEELEYKQNEMEFVSSYNDWKNTFHRHAGFDANVNTDLIIRSDLENTFIFEENSDANNRDMSRLHCSIREFAHNYIYEDTLAVLRSEQNATTEIYAAIAMGMAMGLVLADRNPRLGHLCLSNLYLFFGNVEFAERVVNPARLSNIHYLDLTPECKAIQLAGFTANRYSKWQPKKPVEPPKIEVLDDNENNVVNSNKSDSDSDDEYVMVGLGSPR